MTKTNSTMFRQQRVVIDNISPQLESGSFFIKRTLGERVHVTADILPDGHDVMQAELLYKHENQKKYTEVRMEHLGNDVYQAAFKVEKQGF